MCDWNGDAGDPRVQRARARQAMQELGVVGIHVLERVKAHEDHGGWYESEEGLRCEADQDLVVPSVRWLMEG